MSWERDALWTKARVYFERAFGKSREEPEFGLWCSLGLELLARAAVASVSPVLLAKPNEAHKYLLHALNRGSERDPRLSIDSVQVVQLLGVLFKEFTEENKISMLALLNRRNEELHSGSDAFAQYQPGQWLPGFYRICQNLTEAMGEHLETLFGPDEAETARTALIENENDVRHKVKSTIAAHAKVWEGKQEDEKQEARTKAERKGAELAKLRHHRVECPACHSVAVVEGNTFGKEIVSHDESEINVRQAVSPTDFACSACGLRLSGYAELSVAGLGNQYMRKTTVTPEAFYGLYNEDDLHAEVEARLPEALHDYFSGMEEYDNEG